MASGEGVGEIIPWKNNLVDSVLLFSFFPHTPSLSFPSSKLFFLLPHPPLTLLYSFHLHLNTQHHNFTLLPSFPHLQSFPSFTPPFPHSLTLFFPSHLLFLLQSSLSIISIFFANLARTIRIPFPHLLPFFSSFLYVFPFLSAPPSLSLSHGTTTLSSHPLSFPPSSLAPRRCTNKKCHSHTHTQTSNATHALTHLNSGVPGPLLLQQCPLDHLLSHLLVSSWHVTTTYVLLQTPVRRHHPPSSPYQQCHTSTGPAASRGCRLLLTSLARALSPAISTK